MGFPYPYPLGLPQGSIRASLTILLSINFFLLILRNSPYILDIAILVTISLAFYFTKGLASSVDHYSEPSLRAWGLPARTIRVFLFLSYTGFVVYLFFNSISIPTELWGVIFVIYGYTGGIIWFKLKQLVFGTTGDKTTIFRHLQALLSIIVIISTIVVSEFEIGGEMFIRQLLSYTSVVLGFYYGVRSKATQEKVEETEELEDELVV